MYPEDFYANGPAYVPKVSMGVVEKFEKRRFALIVLCAILAVNSFFTLIGSTQFTINFQAIANSVLHLVQSLV